MEFVASEMTVMTSEELFSIDGGVNWDSIANFAWIAGGTLLCIGGPICKTAGLICCCYAGGYYLGQGIAG